MGWQAFVIHTLSYAFKFGNMFSVPKKSYSNNFDVVIISLTFSVRCASDARCFGFKTTISPPGTTSDLPGYVLTL